MALCNAIGQLREQCLVKRKFPNAFRENGKWQGAQRPNSSFIPFMGRHTDLDAGIAGRSRALRKPPALWSMRPACTIRLSMRRSVGSASCVLERQPRGRPCFFREPAGSTWNRIPRP